MTAMTLKLQSHWAAIRPYLSIRNDEDYARAVQQLNELIDAVGTDENNDLYEFLDTLGTLVHAYEEENMPIPQASGSEVLRFLMDEHGLRQVDLPELGSQGVVSEILSGKRELNVRQIRALAKRFHVSPAVFV